MLFEQIRVPESLNSLGNRIGHLKIDFYWIFCLFYKSKKLANHWFCELLLNFEIVLVELEGVEPSSKQGNNKLSTCLSSLRFSSVGRTEATNSHLILFILQYIQGYVLLSPIYPHFHIKPPRGEGIWEMSRSST